MGIDKRKGNTNIEEKGRGKQQKKFINTKDMVLIGLMVAVLCVLGPVSFVLPISPVPVSLTSLAVNFGAYILGAKRGCITCVVYLFIGFVGLPVFSGFMGGAAKLFGPTGGYLIGYIFMAMCSGFFVERWKEKKQFHIIGMVLGTAVCYGIGTFWLSFQTNMNFQTAFLAGVVPFLPGDMAKIVVVLAVGPKIQKGLQIHL